MEYTAINFEERLVKFSDHFSPKIIAKMNDYQFKSGQIQTRPKDFGISGIQGNFFHYSLINKNQQEQMDLEDHPHTFDENIQDLLLPWKRLYVQ